MNYRPQNGILLYFANFHTIYMIVLIPPYDVLRCYEYQSNLYPIDWQCYEPNDEVSKE